MDKYYEEFLRIANPKTRMDRMTGWWVAQLTKRLPDKYKMLLNCHIIRYHFGLGQWWKPDTARRDKLKSLIPSDKLRGLLSRIIR
jgi:hypothetical protein